jgi:hypothetical protein
MHHLALLLLFVLLLLTASGHTLLLQGMLWQRLAPLEDDL